MKLKKVAFAWYTRSMVQIIKVVAKIVLGIAKSSLFSLQHQHLTQGLKFSVENVSRTLQKCTTGRESVGFLSAHIALKTRKSQLLFSNRSPETALAALKNALRYFVSKMGVRNLVA